MKSKITFIIILFTAFSYAQYAPVGHLTVFSESGDKFFLILNGEQQNDIAQTNVRIEDLSQPYYNAKIIFADKSLSEVSKNYLPITDGDGIFKDVTYKIRRDKNNKSKMKFNFFSMTPVQENYRAPQNVYVVHYGQPSVNVNTNINVGMNVGMNMNVNVHDTQLIENNTSEPNHQYGNPKRCSNKFAMMPADFTSAVASVKKQGFDETKLKVAKQIAGANCLNTAQIAQICQCFGFEDSKLEFAKYAYDFCTEPKNYFKLNNIFAFSSNVDELTQYIESRD